MVDESFKRIMMATPPRIAVAVGLLILAAGFLAPQPFRASSIDSGMGQLVLAAALGMIVLGLVFDVYLYLLNSRRAEFRAGDYDLSSFNDLRAEIESFRARADEVSAKRGKVILSHDDIEEVKRRTIEGLGNDTVEKIATMVRTEIESKSEKIDPAILSVQTAILSSQRRLAAEVNSLGGRANVNLTIGFAVSLIGMIALALFIYSANSDLDGDMDYMKVAIRFLVKLSLVIFMQVFAYFFLRLYRYSLFEIKYFQNELTNIEQRYLALNVALANGNADAVKAISAEMAKTERNFILKKGETTVGLQREEIEARYEAMVTTKAESLLDKLGTIVKSK